MPTDAMTLSEYADLLQNLADEWGGDEEPIVLIGDVTGNVSVSAKDGYSKHGCVAFAHELFETNGVQQLGQAGDKRFFGTMLFQPDDLSDEAVANVRGQEYGTEVSD